YRCAPLPLLTTTEGGGRPACSARPSASAGLTPSMSVKRARTRRTCQPPSYPPGPKRGHTPKKMLAFSASAPAPMSPHHRSAPAVSCPRVRHAVLSWTTRDCFLPSASFHVSMSRKRTYSFGQKRATSSSNVPGGPTLLLSLTVHSLSSVPRTVAAH